MLERCMSLGGGLRKPAPALSAGRMKRPRPLSHYSIAHQQQQPKHQQEQQPPRSSSPVAIVGAGPAGLTLSALLSKFGVPSILLERAAALPTHPQAHFINLRSMEIMRHAFDGLDRTVLEMSPPQEEWRDFVVCSTVLGRQLARVDNFHGGEAERRALSPTGVAHLSQNVLLPLLLQEAERAMVNSCPSSQILFGAEVAGLRTLSGSSSSSSRSTQPRHPVESPQHLPSQPQLELLVRRKGGLNSGPSAKPIAATHRDSSTESSPISCSYVVAADGAGSSVRTAAGIGLSGKRDLGHLVNIHFTCRELADLLLPERNGNGKMRRPGMLYFVYNEETICVLVAHNVQKGEWACQVPFFPPHQTAEFFTEQRSLSIIREALGPGGSRLKINICSVRPWTMNALVADNYFYDGVSIRGGRSFAQRERGGGGGGGDSGVLLVGDAAHQFPPAGGFGLNTGVQDAHNLAWKLAAVHHGLASPELLLSYEQERRPVAMRNAALSVRNLKRSLRVLETLGVDPKLGASAGLMGQLVRSPLTMDWSGSVSGIAAKLLPTDDKPAPATQEDGARRRRLSEERSAERILRLGRRQLESLREEGHPFGESRVRALRRLLGEGGGLPLLFPEHDVGFSYGASASAPSSPSCSGTAIRFGGRMPHFVLKPHPPPSPQDDVDIRDQTASSRGNDIGGELREESGRNDMPMSTPSLSTVDLPDQIRELLLDRFGSRHPDPSSAAVAARFPTSDDGSSAAVPAAFGDLGDSAFRSRDVSPAPTSSGVEHSSGATASGACRARSAARARASMASVLIVSPTPLAAAQTSSSSSNINGGEGGGGDEGNEYGDDITAAAAAEAFSKRWVETAVAAQEQLRQELGGGVRRKGHAATAIQVGEERAGIRYPPPLVVLTVSPPLRRVTTDGGTCGDGSRSSGYSTNTAMTMPVPSSIEHLEAYLDYGYGNKATTTSCPKEAAVVSAVPWGSAAQRVRPTDGVDRRQSGDDGTVSTDDEGKCTKASATTTHKERGVLRQARAGSWVLPMRAIDGSAAGNLGEAFAAAGAEAVLLRPDGHIAWLSPRQDSGDRGRQSSSRVDGDVDERKMETREYGEEDPALVAELGRALDRVYMWDRK